MRHLAPLVLCLTLTACGDWPDVGRASGDTSDTWPGLRPLSEILPGPATDDPEAEAEELRARAAALDARAALLRRPVPDQAAFDRLRAELARR